MPTDSARVMASRYQYQALEFKETAHRCDGVFLPKERGLPLYFVEVQFYRLETVFADLMVKIFTYLKRHDPAQPFRGVILFASQSLQPGHIRCFYLDQMEEPPNSSLGLSIMLLTRRSDDEAPLAARELVARVHAEIADEASRDDLVELIGTVILYKLPRLSREEDEAMLQIHDIRASRVYQEAMEEGRKEGEAKGREEGIALIIVKMARKKSIEEIADEVEMTIEQVRQIIDRVNNQS